MTDDLDRLRAELDKATPSPDATRRAANLALARKNFEATQGNTQPTRPKTTQPQKARGFLKGVFDMFANPGLRPKLLASSGLVAAGLALFVVLPLDDFAPKRLETGEVAENMAPEADVSEPVMEPMVMDEYAGADTAVAAPAPLVKAERKVLGGLVYDDAQVMPTPDREQFANADDNPLQVVLENPVSTFSIDVDTASYAYLRTALEGGTLPQKDAVRIEEMINYFPYDYAAPEGAHPFSTNVSVVPTPWNTGTKLMHIAIQGEKVDAAERPPLDLVFLIDTSGSMNNPNKLPLLKKSFNLLLSTLAPTDKIAIVTYAGSSGLALEPTLASDRKSILAAFDRLQAGGSTAGQAGLQQAYQTAENMADDGRLQRVILATDGDFNVGISDPEALKDYIADKRESGTYLSVLGFGRGNYNDALMQALAQNGNGTAAYIDTLSEAQKVLVDQVSGALFPIADDVKIQVEFNPAQIAEYRLIGYETRALNREDFNNDKVDAGDIGAGTSVTAIYEITPVGSDAVLSDPLRYQSDEVSTTSDELAFVKLRYKAPGSSESVLIETPVSGETTAGTEADFAIAIAGFGQLLRGSDLIGDWTYSDAISMANANKGADPYGYRAEAVQLMRLANSLSR